MSFYFERRKNDRHWNKTNKKRIFVSIYNKVSDKKLAIIKANDMCNIRRLYSREQIEQMQYELEELYEFTNKHVLINLSKLQKDLEQLTEHKDLLNTANKL